MVDYAFTIKGSYGSICLHNKSKKDMYLCLHELKNDHVVGFASVNKKWPKWYNMSPRTIWKALPP